MSKSKTNAQNRHELQKDARHIWVCVVVILVAGIAAFSNSFSGAFVYDDFVSIRDNPHIRNLWPPSEAMSLPLINNGATVSRRPVLSLTFALNHYLIGPAPWGFHLVNLAIHILAALFLFGIVRRTMLLKSLQGRFERQSTSFAVAVALIWMVHPLQTESVTYIVQRAESLMGMLFLLVVYASLRGFQSSRPWPWFGIATLSCAAGMAVKEVMFVAPLIVFLFDGIFVSDSFRSAWQNRRRFYALLASTWLVLLVFQVLGFEDMSQDFTDRSPFVYALTQPGVILFYLRLCFWPAPLVMDYNWPNADSFAAVVPAGCVLMLLLFVACWGTYRRQWYGFLGVWFFLILGPSSSFAALSQNAQQHRMYLSLAAVVLLVVGVVNWLIQLVTAERHAALRRLVNSALVVVVAVFLINRTRTENVHFHREETLWSNNVQKWPASTKARDVLGTIFLNSNRVDEAVIQFREIVALKPDSAGARTSLGNALYVQGHKSEAIAEHERALSIDSQFWLAHFNLATLYAVEQERDPAINHFLKVTQILGQGKKVDYYFEAEIEDRRYDAHRMLGTLFLKDGKQDLAIDHFHAALKIRPDSIDTKQLLERAMTEQSQSAPD